MADKNFSRSVCFVEDNDDFSTEVESSAMQETVFTAIEFLMEEKKRIPNSGTVKERLKYVHERFSDDDLRIKLPEERKSNAKAQKILASSDKGFLVNLNQAMLYAEPNSAQLASLHFKRGIALAEAGEHQQAAKDFEEAAACTKAGPEIKFRCEHKRGQSLAKMKQFKEASTALENALMHLAKVDDLNETTKKKNEELLRISLKKMNSKTCQQIVHKSRCDPNVLLLPSVVEPRQDIPSVSSLVSLKESADKGR